MKAMILAAGMGTRLKPITDTIPKALVPIDGKPLLEILLTKLAHSGCTGATVNVHHFASEIINFIHTHAPEYPFPISISEESNMLLDTGGGLKKARDLLLSGGKEPILIHNVDILSNIDLSTFFQLHHNHLVSLLVSSRESSRYLLVDEKDRLVGWIDTRTGDMIGPYVRPGFDNLRKMAFSGIHIFSPKVFKKMEGWPSKFSIMQFYLSICRDIDIHCAVIPGAKILDVGKIDSLDIASNFLKEI